jgi:hypothetical protein
LDLRGFSLEKIECASLAAPREHALGEILLQPPGDFLPEGYPHPNGIATKMQPD